MNRKSKLLTARLKEILWRNSPAGRSRGRIIRNFAERLGFVYFGSVDKDEHQVRGLTVSTSHQDAHYALGQFDEYDITLVDRLDISLDAREQPIRHDWLIFSVTLKQTPDLPHVFLNPKGHTAFQHLLSIDRSWQAMVPRPSWPSEFYLRYDVLTRVEHMLDVESLLTPELTRPLAAHFWPLAIEIQGSNVYLYAAKQHATTHLLDTMLKNSVWLAQTLDDAVSTAE